jgi:hypothetical protein
MSKKGFAPTIRRIIEVIYGPEPIGEAGIERLATYNRMELSGQPGGGFPHFGMKGEANMTFTGLVASPQTFQGQAQMGATTGFTVQEYPALPSPDAPPALPGVIDLFPIGGSG